MSNRTPDLSTLDSAFDRQFDEADEAALLVDLRAGHREAVDIWFAHYSPQVSAYVATKIDDVRDIQEIVQQTFLNCLKHLPLYRGEGKLFTWMVGIARHEIADYYRKKYAKRALKTVPMLEKMLGEEVPPLSVDISKTVQGILDEMSRRYRQLLLWKYLDNLSVSEIAEKIDKSEKSVESDLYRAREEFKALYRAYA